MSEIILFPVEDLVPHETNQFIYQDHADDELVESVKELGILTPIRACKKGRIIISGHRRVEAAKQLGIEEVPVEFIAKMHPEEITEMLIHMNRQRPRTGEQKAREAACLLNCEDKRRRRLRLSAAKEGNDNPVFHNTPREAVANRLNVSQATVERSVAVTKAIDRAKEEGNEEKAKEIGQAANRSIKGAAEMVRKPAKPAAPKPDAWDFDREGVIEKLELAESAVGELRRHIKEAVDTHGDESSHSMRLHKSVESCRVILTQWKDSVR